MALSWNGIGVHQCAPSCTSSAARNFESRKSASFKLPSSLTSSGYTVEQLKFSADETRLFEALLGIGGRGREASAQQLQDVADGIKKLEEIGGIEAPTSSPLIEGSWQLMYTTRPGSASPIQRTFVGVNAFRVYQEIQLSEEDQRVCNVVKFSDNIGELRVEAAASVQSTVRILFRFDRAAFRFKFLPFKVPYPVPFRLLGDEAKGWLDTTYLSPSGNIRISRGNKGTTFVLQKELEPRQRLLQAIISGVNIEETIEELVALNPSKEPADLEVLAGKWKLVWSSQAKDANWLQQATANIPNWQIIKGATGELQNVVQLLPGLQLKAKAKTEASSSFRRDVNIEGAMLEVGSFSIPIKITGTGYIDLLYIDKKIRVSRGNKGSLFVHIREK